MIVLEKKMTWKEFREMEVDDDDNFIYELINGILMRRTSPILSHQKISWKLSHAFEAFNLKKKIGSFFAAPTDVYLDDNNGVVPDISFVANERNFLIENGEYIAGPPDLIVEIISPGSVKRDRVEKKELYERFSVKEFWLIDPANRTVEIYLIEQDAYLLHAFLEEEGKLTATTAKGFEMEISELFT